MASPPKPWERQGSTPASSLSAAPASSTPSTASIPPAATTTTSTTTPAIPAMPASLATAVNQNAAAYSRPYGSAYSAPYGPRYGGYGSYAGGMGGGMYGGAYGYGGGPFGGGMGGGMYGGAMPGMQGDPNDPNSLTNRFNYSTQATFQILEGMVTAFGGFAQMLESTYMATHSSFFAMVAVAEQFGNLRETLGSVLGIFTLMRWIRTLMAKITGRPPPADATALTPASFARFEGRALPPAADGRPAPARPSRKPLLFFMAAAFGLPYLMAKLIRSLAASHEEEEKRRLALQQQQADPSQLEFCRALYDFAPQPGTPSGELVVKKGDLVAVLSKCDPDGYPSEWWHCRTRDGRMGYLPGNFLEVARRPGGPVAAIRAASSDTSRTNSLTSTVTGTNTVRSEGGHEPVPVSAQQKPGDFGVEGFQKSHFYN